MLISVNGAILGACAHSCRTETFYRASMPDALQGVQSGTRTFFRLSDGVSLAVQECGTAYRGTAGEAVAVCLQLRIEPGHAVTISDGEPLLHVDGASTSIAFERGSRNVAPGAVLTGGTDPQCNALYRSIAQSDCWMPYFAALALPRVTASTFSVDLGSWTIDGRAVRTPTLRFARVTDQVCYTNV